MHLYDHNITGAHCLKNKLVFFEDHVVLIGKKYLRLDLIEVGSILQHETVPAERELDVRHLHIVVALKEDCPLVKHVHLDASLYAQRQIQGQVRPLIFLQLDFDQFFRICHFLIRFIRSQRLTLHRNVELFVDQLLDLSDRLIHY